MLAIIFSLIQEETRATPPVYFIYVLIALLVVGAVGWLVAAVLGFARAPAFGPPIRWFALSAVCMIIYHLHFLVFGILVSVSGGQAGTDFGSALGFGAFFNLFVVLGSVCAIIGFLQLTSTRR